MTLLTTIGGRRRSRFYTLGTGKSLDLSSAPVNLVVDGNSIMTSAYSAVGAFHASLLLYEPLASAVDTSATVAISGQTWADMAHSHADTDSAWVEGATNILFLGETRNQIVINYGVIGITDLPTLVASCQSAIQNYLTAVRAVHPGWAVIIGGTLPSGGADTIRYQVENAAFSEVDAWLAANVDTLGLHAFVSFRSHPAFDHDGTAPEPFEAYPTFWQETADRWTHPKDPGKAVMSQNVNAAIAALSQ